MSSDNVGRLAAVMDWQPEDMDRARWVRKRTMFGFLMICLAVTAPPGTDLAFSDRRRENEVGM